MKKKNAFVHCTLEFSLLFDAHNQVLHCTVYRAKGLKPTDIDGLADPFVRLQIIPSQSKSRERILYPDEELLRPNY
ncbi:hypothetical protein TNCV_2310671 [Trichonephila clavipes]|nr:hypothetical protein TNCV_2310671 [Trichonephila clavipes]